MFDQSHLEKMTWKTVVVNGERSVRERREAGSDISTFEGWINGSQVKFFHIKEDEALAWCKKCS